jgi:hypothetical protein
VHTIAQATAAALYATARVCLAKTSSCESRCRWYLQICLHSVLRLYPFTAGEKENIDGEEFQQIILASGTEQYRKDDAPGVTIPYQTAATA